MTFEQTQPVRRKVGIGLGIGIFLLPIVFAWFTLRQGYSTAARVISLLWLGLSSLFWLIFWIGAIGAAVSGTYSELEEVGSPTEQVETVVADETAVETAPAPRRSSQISMAQYNQIQPGMSYSEVVSILGREGEEMSSNEVGGYRTVMYVWENRFGANMNAMFQNDEMVQKAQFGLD